jgi:hypothetical protein
MKSIYNVYQVPVEFDRFPGKDALRQQIESFMASMVDQGYSIREVSHEICSEVMSIEGTMVVTRALKMRKATRND